MLFLPSGGPVSHVGLYVNAGTRDEEPGENGLAHFIEHTIFKGTRKRKAYHILTRLECVGGELNAYTAKEETCIYATALNEHLTRAMELIADIVMNSTFPARELKKEIDVVLDEINSYKDSPAEEIFDVFEEKLFAGHPLSMNILGTPGDLKGFTPERVRRFVDRHYLAGSMALCITGNISSDRAFRYAGKYFGGIREGRSDAVRRPFNGGTVFREYLERKTWQTHSIIGGLAYDRRDARRIPMFLLNNILGGPALNSRLNLAVRERHGYTYSIESAYHPYTDTGVFSIYMGADDGNLSKAMALVEKELAKVREVPLGALQLQQARKQLIGQIAISNESNLNRMLSAGKTYLHDDRVDTIREIRTHIESITRDQILEAAGEVLAPGRLSLLVFRP